MTSFDIIKSPRLTEKGSIQSDKSNAYTIKADPRATKLEIRRAVEELFKVKVLSVRTMNVTGKMRRQRTHQAGKSRDWKKAIVTLKEGDKIVLT